MNPHCFWKLDPYPFYSEKLDPDPHKSQNSGAFETQESSWRRGRSDGGVKAKNGDPEGL